MPEKEYIDREALINYCKNIIQDKWNENTAPISWAYAYADFIDDIETLPSADVVEVVRCKDCKYNGSISCPTFNDNPNGKDWQALENNDFCSFGKRKD